MRTFSIILICLLFASAAFAQTSWTSADLDTGKFTGVYFGVTFKKNLQLENSVLEAGYAFRLKEDLLGTGNPLYMSLGIDYDTDASPDSTDRDVYSIQPNFFYPMAKRIYATGGLGFDFYNASKNNTWQWSGGFGYNPDAKFLGSMELFIAARVQETKVFIPSSGPKVNNTTSGREIWLTVAMLGL